MAPPYGGATLLFTGPLDCDSSGPVVGVPPGRGRPRASESRRKFYLWLPQGQVPRSGNIYLSENKHVAVHCGHCLCPDFLACATSAAEVSPTDTPPLPVFPPQPLPLPRLHLLPQRQHSALPWSVSRMRPRILNAIASCLTTSGWTRPASRSPTPAWSTSTRVGPKTLPPILPVQKRRPRWTNLLSATSSATHPRVTRWMSATWEVRWQHSRLMNARSSAGDTDRRVYRNN